MSSHLPPHVDKKIEEIEVFLVYKVGGAIFWSG